MVGSSNSSVDAVPTIHGSSGAAIFANGGYALHSNAGTVSIYPNPAPATSSSSITMPMPHQMVIQSHPPATSAATSTSMWIAQPLTDRTAAASRHARRVSAGLANNGRYRRARSSYYSLHPLMMVEAEVDSFSSPVSMKLS